MSEARNQVLIVEDDSTLSSAMAEALKRAGLTVYATHRLPEAKDLLEKKPIGTVFIDCLMPETSGVEFAQQVRSRLGRDQLQVILMSGIFTDPAFVKESLTTAQAEHFLKKPFNLNDMFNFVEKPQEAVVETTGEIKQRKSLYSWVGKDGLSLRDKRKALEAEEESHGFDLPFIYNFIVQSKMSGHLNVIGKAGDISGVTFCDGLITMVDIPDKATFVGKLIVDHGYALAEDIDRAEKLNSNQRFGEKLIQSYAVSPHAVQEALSYQMTLRLSKTIVDQPVKLNFSQTETTLDTPNISPDLFLNQLHDWVSSKVGSDWLKVNFVPWSTCSLVEGPAFTSEHPALQLPLITALPNFIENVLSGKTFHDILEQKLYEEEPFQKAMHFLLIQGVISWNRGDSASQQDSQKKLLTKINHQMSGKKNFEIYDVMVQMVSGRANQPDRVYQDFMAMLGEKPSDKDPQLLALYNEVVKILTQAYQFSKSGSYIRTKNEAEKGDAEKQAKLGNILEEAKFAMSSSNFKAAATQLAQIRAKDPNLPGLRVVWCWSLLANLNSSTPGSAKSATLKSVEIELLQVSPEEKLEALYSFVQGLVAKFKGDPTSAKKLFEKSLSLDSKFIPAKRELNFLNVRPTGDKDLKDVFGSLFKKK